MQERNFEFAQKHLKKAVVSLVAFVVDDCPTVTER